MTLRARPLILGTGVLLLIAYLTATIGAPKPDGRIVMGDATHHFVQLRSVVYDGDLDFKNEYMRIYRLDAEVPGTEWIFSDLTPTGRVRNYMPVGPAVLWAPLYVLLSLVQWLASLAGWAAPPDGFERLLQLAPGVTGIIAATGAALLSWRLASRWTSASAATVGVIGTWLGSHAVYYSLISPTYSHAPSMFTASLFFYGWLTGRDRLSIRRAATWGLLAGLCALMRWQDAIFLIVPVIEILRWSERPARRALALAAAGLAFTAAFVPQTIVWTVLYGQPLAIPQGASFMQWTSPHLIDVLVSDNHGLLSWAPLLVLALAGLVAALVREPAWRLPISLVLLLSWYVNAAVADWWAGEAYGARRFLSLFPLFALGLATWIDRATDARARLVRNTVVVVLCALNGLLLLQYQLFMRGLTTVAPYPEGWHNLIVERFIVPWRLIGWLASGS